MGEFRVIRKTGKNRVYEVHLEVVVEVYHLVYYIG